MIRLVAAASLAMSLLTVPAFAASKDEALAACAKYLQRSNGVPPSTTMGFQGGGSGERFNFDGTANYQGRDGVRVVCKTNKGRVTGVVWG